MAQCFWICGEKPVSSMVALLLLAVGAGALQAPASRRETFRWSGGGGGDVDISYTVAGDASASACVVFAPGFGAGAFQFEAITSLVAERGVCAYCMDWFGQGASWPDEARAGSKFGIESWATQLCDFLASEALASHETVFVAGNSVGGLTSAIAAARDGARCDGLIMLNPTPFWSFWGPEGSPFWAGTLPAPGPLRAFAKAWFDSLRSPVVVKSLLREVYATKDACDDALAERITDAASHPVGPDAFASILFSGRARLEFADALRAVADRNLKLALVYGKEDPWIQPVWGQRAARRLADAGAHFDYLEISPSGHCPHHETPRATAAAVNGLLDAWLDDDRPALDLPAAPVTEADGRRVSVARATGAPRDLFERLVALAPL